jgi:hypothetical protein
VLFYSGKSSKSAVASPKSISPLWQPTQQIRPISAEFRERIKCDRRKLAENKKAGLADDSD